MTIKTFQCNMLQENCYVVSDETREAVIIDCGAYYDAERQAIVNYCEDNGLTLKHHLCTHTHFDHIFGCDTIYERYGLKPEIHPADEPVYRNIDRFCIDLLGTPLRAHVASRRLPCQRTADPLWHPHAEGAPYSGTFTRLRVLLLRGRRRPSRATRCFA